MDLFETVFWMLLPACGVIGFVTGWILQMNFFSAALVSVAAVFLGTVLIHLLTIGPNVIEYDGPAQFYAMVCTIGLVPALIGSSASKFLKRKIET